MKSNERSLEVLSAIAGVALLLVLVCFVNFLASQDPKIVLLRQYIVLLRMPIIAGLVLALFPLISKGSNLLQNLFVMRGAWQLASVLFFSTATAFMITSSFKFIAGNSPYRLNIEPIDSINGFSSLDIPGKIINVVIFIVHLLPQWLLANPEVLLLAPTWLITIWLSMGEDNFRHHKIKYIFCGLLGLVSSLMLGIFLHREININHFKGLQVAGVKPEYTSNFLLLIISGFVVYFAVYFLFNPKNLKSRFNQKNNKNRWLQEAPALFYVLLLIFIFTGVFSLATFYVDKWHIPLVLVVILFSGSMYLIGYVDHFFRLDECAKRKLDKRDNFSQIINKRLKIQDQWIDQDRENHKGTLVVIATSGGGIQASGWTAQVLCGLQEELGASFTQSIGLISSVSGGSVGTMFFLDQFDQVQHYPSSPSQNQDSDTTKREQLSQFKNPTLNSIFQNATEDWLDAVGWGLAYPDMIKGFFGISLGKHNDRGYSLEWDWQRDLKNSEATLATWRKKVLQGEIPIPIFNATLVEDGRRFLISPVKLINRTLENLIGSPSHSLEVPKGLDFHTLYSGYDLDVTTAARLSATFPYVSPIARNDNDGKNGLTHNYHVADGGFFDNAGLFTAIEWLDTHLDSLTKVERVLLVQINAIPGEKLQKKQKGGLGWWMQSIGPLKTLNSIRDSTQIARNIREIELIKDKWSSKGKKRRRVDFRTCTIDFPEEYNPPLSWTLTGKQIKNLKDAWKKKTTKESFKELKELWRSSGIDQEGRENWHLPEKF